MRTVSLTLVFLCTLFFFSTSCNSNKVLDRPVERAAQLLLKDSMQYDMAFSLNLKNITYKSGIQAGSALLNSFLKQIGLSGVDTCGVEVERNALFFYAFPQDGGRYFERGKWCAMYHVTDEERLIKHFERQGVKFNKESGVARGEGSEGALGAYEVQVAKDVLVLVSHRETRFSLLNLNEELDTTVLVNDFIHSNADVALFSREVGTDYYKFLPEEIGGLYKALKGKMPSTMSLMEVRFKEGEMLVDLKSDFDESDSWLDKSGSTLSWPGQNNVALAFNLKDKEAFSVLSEVSAIRMGARELLFADKYLTGRTMVVFDTLDYSKRVYFFEMKKRPSDLVKENLLKNGYILDGDFVFKGNMGDLKRLPDNRDGRTKEAFKLVLTESTLGNYKSFGLDKVTWSGDLQHSSMRFESAYSGSFLKNSMPGVLSILANMVTED